MFFLPKKKVVLHCYTDVPAYSEYAPIEKASNFFPDWWKNLPKSYKEGDLQSSTMKGCVGFTDLYSRGFILPMWSEVNIAIGEIGNLAWRYQYRDKTSHASFHPAIQRGDYLPENHYQHLKLVAPWRFHCDYDVDFMFVEPTYNMEELNTYKVLPGVLNFKYQSSVNVNLMITKKPEAYELQIPFLRPMAHIIPLDNKEIEIKVSYDPEKHKYYSDLSKNLTLHNYRTRKKIIKEKEKKRCPFNFGE